MHRLPSTRPAKKEWTAAIRIALLGITLQVKSWSSACSKTQKANSRGIVGWTLSDVAVEKRILEEAVENSSRQDTLLAIFSAKVDIFYHRI